MVHAQPNKDNALPQFREEPARELRAPPLAGEIVGHGEPPYGVRGFAALAPILATVRFPATKQEIVSRIGGAVIAVDSSKTVRVSEILELTAPPSFRSRIELEEAVRRVWDRIQPHYEKGRGAHHQRRE